MGVSSRHKVGKIPATTSKLWGYLDFIIPDPALYQSAATRNFILKEFKGPVLPVF